MDRFDAMSVLLAVVRAGSFSAASRMLGVPVASVSRRIAELEEHLSTTILIRSSRRMVLTDAGRAYVDACKRILESVDEAERVASGEYSEPKGDLTITAPVSFGRIHLVPVVVEFLSVYPDIDVRLVLSDRRLDLLEDNVALAVRIGNLADSSLIATRLGSTRIVACASPHYLAARGRPEKPDDLRNHDCITFDNLTSPDAWRFADRKGEIVVPIRSRLTVNTAEAAIGAAIDGLGVLRMMSYKIEDARRAGALEIVLEAFEAPPWPVSILYPGQGSLPLKLRTFVNFATPRLRARLP